MQQKLLSEEIVQYISDEVMNHFDLVIAERGFDYYRQGNVYNLEYLDNNRVIAAVQGSQEYEVTLDLDFFSISRCNCPYGGYCKHIAAVFFHIYAKYGRPRAFLDQWRYASADSGGTAPEPRKPQAALPKNPAFQTSLAPPAETASIQEWLPYLEQQYEKFSKQNIANAHYAEAFFPPALSYLSQEMKLDHWQDEPLKLLFKIYSILFMMQKTEKYFENTQTSYQSYYITRSYHMIGERFFQILQQNADPLSSQEWSDKHIPVVEETIGLLNNSISYKSKPLMNWVLIYRYLWFTVFDVPRLLEQEVRRLHKALAGEELSPQQRYFFTLASAHFLVAEGHDEQARRQLDTLAEMKINDFVMYLHTWAETEDWQRLLDWLRWLKPLTAQASQDVFSMIGKFWSLISIHLESDEEWFELLVSLLPKNTNQFIDYLFRSKRYGQWVSFHLIKAISPADMPKVHLKLIEAEDTASLLPLYHQSVEREILLKNRQAYKSAIRLLKKLKSYYKKLKMSDRFEHYIHRLALQHHRLRAFQE
ncbi:MAG TPA: SWIM zinc finger family protein, partial [Bacilli bacterium]